jgi:hypothetical protein
MIKTRTEIYGNKAAAHEIPSQRMNTETENYFRHR